MVYLPQDVFKRILSFKDPRYERVMTGTPYMATPTRVFYTRDEVCNDTIPALFRHHDENDLSPYADVLIITFDFDERGILFSPMQVIRHLESIKNPIIDSDDETDETGDVIKCSIKATEMSLQCEPCGPDLELYQRRR